MLLIQGASADERVRIVTLMLSSSRFPPSSQDVGSIFNFLQMTELPKC